ncbi:hypothetical protein E0E52_12455 [Azotobacter chroococcum]|uniref:hypothetical protein n=1 Tax=Azotobacter chroococcum TaxID=353 RepID=UPI00103AA64B|nr:hypothetical protein [Azotobacter chroococcum]TBW07221.1 hypothetical protein E0E52_12455 [Azotobacter chroococcum]
MADLYKDEYQTLRKEVETAMSELNTLESAALLAVATIFSWLVTHASESVIRLGWFIPAILVFFCILRAWSINRHLGWLGEYLKEHETVFIQPQLRGWEHFIGDPAPETNKPRRGFRGRLTFFFWVALLVTAVVGGLFGYANKPIAPEVSKCDGKSCGLTSLTGLAKAALLLAC